jgi:hypothetical protein
MSNFQFDYDTFYNYYTTDSKFKPKISTSRKEIWFYRGSGSKEPETDFLSDKYITIGVTRVYISKGKEQKNKDKDELFFSIPEKIGDKWWDHHFHFGKDYITPPEKQYRPTNKNTTEIPVVFFHKTIQNPLFNRKERTNCYYHQNMEIHDIADIICLQEKNTKMDQHFSTKTKDFHLIKEIISRPFLDKSHNTKISYSKALTSNKSNTQHHSSTHKNTKHSGNSPRGGTKKKKIRKYRRKSLRRR